MQVNNSYFINKADTSFEGKVRFKRTSLFDSRRICTFDVNHPKFDKLKIVSEKCNGKRRKNEFAIKVLTEDSLCLAKERLLLNNNNEEVYGCYIETARNCRRNSLGEILRLASIMTMLENKTKTIKLFSILDSVVFHSKYKFEPDITEPHEAKKILMQIRKLGNKEHIAQAETLLRDFDIKHMKSNDVYGEINLLAKDFLQEKISKNNYDRNTFDCWSCDMSLTKESIIKNKDYFNKLFKKHGIEYKI